jgi:excisionase family DNA binding protein
MSRFLTVKEVAQIFNVSVSSVNRLMDKRKIPFFKIGGSIRFSDEDVNQYLQDNYWDWAKHPKIKI